MRYVRDNKTLGLKYYANMKDELLYDLLRQANINTDNQLMVFSDYICQDCPDTGISTGTYMIFYQGLTNYHGTHVSGPVFQSGAESNYNTACTEEMALAHFRMLVHELLNKDTDIFPEEDPIIILDSKPAVCMAKNGNDTKHTRHI